MTLTEYDEQEQMELFKKEGRTEERVNAIIELLEDYGMVPEELVQAIYEQTDIEVLRRWTKLAARVGSLEAFEKAIGFEE